MRQTFFGRVRSVAGTALMGVGILVLYKNLDRAACQLGHFFGSTTLGILPTTILVAVRVLQAYASDRERFLLGLLQHVLVTFWPLLLVTVGITLSRDTLTGKVDATTKQDRGLVDLTARRSTLK